MSATNQTPHGLAQYILDDTPTMEDANNDNEIIERGLQKNDDHVADHNNPHNTTKELVGLGNVDNTSDAEKPVSTAQQTAINAMGDLKIPKTAIVNDLTTGGNENVLSAEQGKALKLDVDAKEPKQPGKSLSTNDFDNGYKAQLDGLSAALAAKVGVSDIIDDLVTGGSNKPLSAQQGVALQASKADQPYQQHTQTDGSWSVTDSAGGLVKEASISGNTIQNGTPTPEAPITPVCLASGTEIKVVGKNEFDGVSVLNAFISSTSAINSSSTSRLVFSKCLPNTTYTISKISGRRFYIGYTNTLPTSNVNVYGVYMAETPNNLTLTTGSDAQYIVAYVYNSTHDTTITAEEMLASVQIEKSPVATPYEPYTNPTTLTVPCDLRMTPDGSVRDVLEPLTGKVTPNMVDRIFTGAADEAWQLNTAPGSGKYCFKLPMGYSAKSSNNNLRNAWSDKFSPAAWQVMYYSSEDGIARNGDSLNVRYSALTTVAEWKTYLQSNPMRVVCPKADADIVPIYYAPQPIALPQGVVNMVVESSNGVLPSKVDMLYRQDLKAYIESIVNGIYDTLATNITDLTVRVTELETAGGD